MDTSTSAIVGRVCKKQLKWEFWRGIDGPEGMNFNRMF